MKKTDGLTKAVGILLFLAMLCYAGFAVARRLTSTLQTALAAETTLTLSADMSGLVIRSEQPVFSDRSYIDVTAADGQRLAAGEAIATVYATPQALDRAVELRELTQELAALEAGTQESGQTEPGAAYTAIHRLAASVQSGDMAAALLAAEALEELLLPASPAETEADGEYLITLTNRRNQLLEAAVRDSETVTAEDSGLFTRVTDGFETLTPEDALALTPDTLRAYMNETRTGAKNALGKLVTGFTWYYAALLDESDAARLAEGDELALRFARYCSGTLRARVAHISEAQGGECAVVFSLDEGMAELLTARRVAASLEFESYTGIRVPQKALYRYWAGEMAEADAAQLAPGEALTLMKGSWSAEVTVSEIGAADDEGQCQIVVYWPWAEDNAPPAQARDAALVSADAGAGYYAADLYDAERQKNCLCVFTMTGLQAERKKVELGYVGEDYVLVLSQGSDGLRAGNELIVRADTLYDGHVFD